MDQSGVDDMGTKAREVSSKRNSRREGRRWTGGDRSGTRESGKKLGQGSREKEPQRGGA